MEGGPERCGALFSQEGKAPAPEKGLAEDSDSEEEVANEEIQLPAHKVQRGALRSLIGEPARQPAKLIGEPARQPAKLIGEPTKGRLKWALRTALVQLPSGPLLTREPIRRRGPLIGEPAKKSQGCDGPGAERR